MYQHQLPKINCFFLDWGTGVLKVNHDALERGIKGVNSVREEHRHLFALTEVRLLIFTRKWCPPSTAVVRLLNYLVSHSREQGCGMLLPSATQVTGDTA